VAGVVVATAALIPSTPLGGQISAPGDREHAAGERAARNDPSDDIPPDLIGAILDTMTVEEKVGQMFMVDTSALEAGVRGSDGQLGVSPAQADHLARYGPGGVIFFGGNVADAGQVSRYIADLQAASPIPLFVAVDQEGGDVERLGAAGVTSYPSMRAIGASGDPVLARGVGETLGREMSALGFTVDLAPVADVDTNPANPVIGDRSFGPDPALVAAMVAAEVDGLQPEVSAALKHFPGHGDTATDSHTGLPIVGHDLDRLRAVELVPFKAGIDAGADFVLTAHIAMPAIDPSGAPATMSRTIVTDVLRGELGFEGIVITDSLGMGAVDAMPIEELVRRCVDAGVDMLLMPTDFFAARDALVRLVESGRIGEERVDESVRRIVALKLDKLLRAVADE
jgi:beta-N-acetylhexosaminidase